MLVQLRCEWVPEELVSASSFNAFHQREQLLSSVKISVKASNNKNKHHYTEKSNIYCLENPILIKNQKKHLNLGGILEIFALPLCFTD